jgi:hypothetical protein
VGSPGISSRALRYVVLPQGDPTTWEWIKDSLAVAVSKYAALGHELQRLLLMAVTVLQGATGQAFVQRVATIVSGPNSIDKFAGVLTMFTRNTGHIATVIWKDLADQIVLEASTAAEVALLVAQSVATGGVSDTYILHIARGRSGRRNVNCVECGGGRRDQRCGC